MSVPMRLDTAAQLPVLWEDDSGPAEDASALRRRLVMVGGFFLLLLLLAAFVPIGGAVMGSGQVGVESRVKRVAHPTGGVIAEINVSNGQHVEKGEVLIRLDDKVTGADATYSTMTVEQLLAQRARLEAERLGTGSIAFPAELTASSTPSARAAMVDEARLFAIRRSEAGQLHAQLGARVAQFQQQITGYQAQIHALEEQRSLIEPERKGVKELWDKQLVTISRLNQLERTAADIDGSIASLQAQIASTRARITEAQEQSIQLGESRRADAGKELAQINAALNQQQIRSVSAEDLSNRSEIRAPYAGTVEKIAFAAIGDVVRPAEPILEIIPDADQMVVEAMVSPTDIDQLRKGQTARVHFSAFNRASTPEIDGTVAYVATDRTDNAEAHQAYYMVRVVVDQAQLRKEGLTLRSGMPAEVYIQTGYRSMLSYLFKPLRDQMLRAFRDN